MIPISETWKFLSINQLCGSGGRFEHLRGKLGAAGDIKRKILARDREFDVTEQQKSFLRKIKNQQGLESNLECSNHLSFGSGVRSH